MRRRLINRIEKAVNFINLLNVGLIVAFIFAAAFTELKDLKAFSVVACSVLFASGLINLAYWIIWQKFNR